MPDISGNYEGEGINVSPAGPAIRLDIGKDGIKGNVSMATIDRRRRVRVSNEAARTATAINVGGGDQILAQCSRGVYVSANGNLVVRLADDTADATFTGVLAGNWYPFAIAIVRQTGSTATGVLTF